MRGGGGSQGGCELRSEAFVKIKKKKKNRGGGEGAGWGVQGGCEWRGECIVKIKKKIIFFFGGGGWSGQEGGRVGGYVRVDGN